MVLVATQVKRRRGTTAENDAFTGAEGEITVDLTKKTLRVHDGSTQGGTELAKSSDIYTQTEIDDLLSGKSSTDLSNITADGKETIAHNAMPSDRYIDLTIGASGANYTAPADGYFAFFTDSITTSILVAIDGLYGNVCTGSTGFTNWNILPVQKGKTVVLYYGVLGSSSSLRFVYAQGAV